ncbi:MAG: tetratricopeptide repeat protein [Solirubrobacterales bacterium]|nr:tetratricopeptide repeat protein [Solirubrobacterales bacterium]
MSADDWTSRVQALWDEFDSLEPDVFVSRMRALVSERPEDDAIALFELAGAYDSTGDEARAATTYERVFAVGPPEAIRRSLTIQYASTLRNLGRATEAVAHLERERERTSDVLDDAVTVFLAFALVDAGAPVRAVGELSAALGTGLPQYRRSVSEYARELRQRD